MTSPELDPERGKRVAQKLRDLGVTGILLKAAEDGYITELACAMPECLCPDELGGRTYFEEATQPMPDWAPNHEHYPIAKRDGGHRSVDNSILAHVLCNRVDYSKQIGRSYDSDLERVRKAREGATGTASEK